MLFRSVSQSRYQLPPLFGSKQGVEFLDVLLATAVMAKNAYRPQGSHHQHRLGEVFPFAGAVPFSKGASDREVGNALEAAGFRGRSPLGIGETDLVVSGLKLLFSPEFEQGLQRVSVFCPSAGIALTALA